jgi:hypothetical protein
MKRPDYSPNIDAMRDMVDKQLEIKKENGFSKIDNTV